MSVRRNKFLAMQMDGIYTTVEQRTEQFDRFEEQIIRETLTRLRKHNYDLPYTPSEIKKIKLN